MSLATPLSSWCDAIGGNGGGLATTANGGLPSSEDFGGLYPTMPNAVHVYRLWANAPQAILSRLRLGAPQKKRTPSLAVLGGGGGNVDKQRDN